MKWVASSSLPVVYSNVPYKYVSENDFLRLFDYFIQWLAKSTIKHKQCSTRDFFHSNNFYLLYLPISIHRYRSVDVVKDSHIFFSSSLHSHEIRLSRKRKTKTKNKKLMRVLWLCIFITCVWWWCCYFAPFFSCIVLIKMFMI